MSDSRVTQSLRRSAATAALLLLVLMLPLSGCGKDDSTESTSGEAAAPVAEGSSAQAPADTGTWSMVTLVDGSPVFGHRKDSGVEGTFALVDAFFVAGGDAADVNTLRPFGSEIHRPLQMLIIPWTSVVYEEPLAADAPAVTAIGEYQAANPVASPEVPSFEAGAYAAVFLRTGEVFFGKLIIEGEAVTLSGAHFLRFKDAEADDAREITSLDQVELIPESQAAAGSTGEMVIPMGSVLYFQPLAADSPVVAALTAQQ